MNTRTFEELPGRFVPGLPVAGLPYPFPPSLQQLAARTPPVPRKAAEAPSCALERQLSEAHASLVSAACYLSTAPAAASAVTLEALLLLHDLSQEVMGSSTLPAKLLQEMEDGVWQSKQLQWERQRSVEAAIRHVKAGAEPRRIDQPASPRSSPRSWLARWWSLLRRPAQVYPF